MQDKKPILVDIPQAFYSDETNAPFMKCLNCECNLLDNHTQYIIEKAIKRYKDYSSTDTIFEYAICLNCHQKFMSVYSSESLSNIQNYFIENAHFDEMREGLVEKLEDGTFEIDEWISNCVIKGTSVKELTEYQIGAQFVGNKMAVSQMPFMIGGAAMDDVMMLLSDKTIDEMNGFIDEFFGLPPDLKKLLKDNGVLIF
ncbi:MAG: hypothetical protein DWQ03_21140 [Calditrichaeota bacterium]|nr:MAG: hypothetical protein DWQ03_21140 [Calditrichota bacterium]NOG44633.1 hypothetical protein [Calditrichota bacterium]